MLKCLREVNSDSNSVGWYQSTYLGSYLGQAMIETQFQYQVNSPKSIVVVYGAIRFCNGATVLLKFFFFFFMNPRADPLRTNHGSMSLRAFRLSKKVMDLYADKKFTFERYVDFLGIFCCRKLKKKKIVCKQLDLHGPIFSRRSLLSCAIHYW